MLFPTRPILLLMFVILCLFPAPIAAQDFQEIPPVRARVVDVCEAGFQPDLHEDWDTQLVTLKLTTGPHKNQTITILNTLTGHPLYDISVKKGDKVLLQPDYDGAAAHYYLADFDRQTPLKAISALFILSVLLIGGRKGAKALLSLLGMGIIITAMILPLILKGFNPILVTVGLSSLMTVLFVYFVTGRGQKTTAAILGTIGGLLISGLSAYLAGKASYLTGLSSEEAQMLQFLDSSINFEGLLFSGMIIGALGAILDVGISIASAMEQIKEADPQTDFQTLFQRGLRVGRDLIATMSNTLILAYVGSALPLLLLFHAHGPGWSQVINLDLIATEIIRAMTGSIGLTLAIPLTAFAAAFFLVKPEHKGKNLRH